MKVLIVSNRYPPHYVGGYELRCSLVAEYLREAGHEVRVLTSSYPLPVNGDGSNSVHEIRGGVRVERSLCYYPCAPLPSARFYVLALAKRQLADVRRLTRVLDEFRPDVVNWWNLEGLAKAILPVPAWRGIPDVHCVADTWMIREYGLHGETEPLFWFDFWQGRWGPRVLRPLIQRALIPWERGVQREGIPTRPFPNSPRHVWFVSEFMRLEHIKAGMIFPSSEVIYSGVSSERFYAPRARSDFHAEPLRILYAGYVEPTRGLHTVVEALGLLSQDVRERIEFSVAPNGEAPEYVKQVKKRIEQLGLSKRVTFWGKVPHEEMPRVYREHHLLVFASTRLEGLPLTMMEAMCAGCAVITTGSGGALELADRADLPIFPKDHPLGLSRLIARLAKDRNLVFEIGSRGQEVALREFTFDRMVRRISNTFQTICGQTSGGETDTFTGGSRLQIPGEGQV